MENTTHKHTNKYTEEELIHLLYIWITDYNKLPTYREISADDRMPTHYTYVKRFGLLKNLFQIAGISEVQDTSILHNLAKDILRSDQEYVRIKDITVNFLVEKDHNIFAVDIVNLGKFDISQEIKDKIINYRKSRVEDYNYKYILIEGLLDFQKLEKLKE